MKALIVVDIQNDFCPGGALAVDDGDKIIPTVNKLQQHFDLVVATQDWHPADHGSFASNHAGKEPGEIIDLNGIEQILWPDHCVQGSHGAEFHQDLDTVGFSGIFRKGTDKMIDSYSGFYDNGHQQTTGLSGYLKDKGVDTVYIAGLTTDYCAKFTALDAVNLGFETYMIEDATRAVNLNEGDGKKAIDEMKSKGVKIIQSDDILG